MTTVVNHETGEVLDPEEADRRAQRISLRLDNAATNFEAAMSILRTAIAASDHFALGYRSPGDYISDRFGGKLSRLGVDMRREVVRELTDAGLSTRAIAPVLDISQRTVVNDRQVSNIAHPPQTPEPADGGEASTGSGQTVDEVEARDTVERDADDTSPAAQPEGASTGGATPEPEGPPFTPPAPRPPVIGIDGKTYAPSAPKKREPKPVLEGAAAEYDNAEQSCIALARAVSKLLQFQHPNMRVGMQRYWSMASVEVSPVQRADVTPEQMRAAAHGLLALADEWNRP